jgi:hypothetical protein
MRHLQKDYIWQVEFTVQTDRSWTANQSVTVIAATIDQAIAATYDTFKVQAIIKAFRGERYGSQGILIINQTPSE